MEPGKNKPSLLVGSRYEELAKLLWQQWKFLCDPPTLA